MDAGWYNDSEDDAFARWHDGQGWTEHRMRKSDWSGPGAPPPPGTPTPAQPAWDPEPQRASSLGAPPPVPQQQPQVIVQKQRGCLWWVGLGVAVLVAIAIIAAVAGGGSDSDNDGEPDVVDVFENDEPENMSLDEFNRISNGMSYDEVEAIVGGPGELSSETDIAGTNGQIYTWDGNGDLGANAIVQFQDDGVISKSQFGLEDP